MNQPKAKEQPLAWGIRRTNGPLKHVLQISPQENGAACACDCPGCGAPLLAVNADKDAAYLMLPRTQRRYFKHASGKQHFSCLVRAARAAALWTLMAEDSVYLPPHRLRSYESEALDHLVAKHPGERVAIKSRHWIDSFHGVLILSDGREILLTAHVESELAQTGKFERVIRIDCDDPLVATMSAEEIIERLRAPHGQMLCWKRHEEDERLAQELREQADEYLSGVPPELLAGLGKLHANETILHWLIKEAVRKNPVMRVPKLEDSLTSKSFKDLTVDFSVPALVLELREPKLEAWTGSIVPDVVCKAVIRGATDEPFDLLIEAAVTNKVGQEKLAKIQGMRVAAIEIRSDRFKRVGFVKASVIEDDVCNDPSNKKWLSHPLYEEYRRQAHQELSRREKGLREEATLRESLNRWHRDATLGDLYRTAYQLLVPLWDKKRTSFTAPNGADLMTIRAELSRRRETDLTQTQLSSESGLLAAMRSIQQRGNGHLIKLSIAELMASALASSYGEVALGPYLLLALDCWCLNLNDQEQRIAQQLQDEIIASFKNGSTRYCREERYDIVLRHIFPELGRFLDRDFCTTSHAKSVYVVAAEERNRRQRAAEAEMQARDEAALAQTLELQAREREERRQLQIQEGIERVSNQWTWTQVTSSTSALASVLRFARKSSSVSSQNLDPDNVVTVFHVARHEGRSIGDALRELRIQDPEDTGIVMTLLQRCLLVRKMRV